MWDSVRDILHNTCHNLHLLLEACQCVLLTNCWPTHFYLTWELNWPQYKIVMYLSLDSPCKNKIFNSFLMVCDTFTVRDSYCWLSKHWLWVIFLNSVPHCVSHEHINISKHSSKCMFGQVRIRVWDCPSISDQWWRSGPTSRTLCERQSASGRRC